MSRGELGTVVLAGGLLVVASPQVFALAWTPKVALLLIAVGPGVVALAIAAMARDRAAQAGLAFLGVAGLATVLGPMPMLSLVGIYNDGSGWLFVAAVVGLWALGRRMSSVGAHALGTVVLVAAAINAAMAWVQMMRTVSGPMFNLVDGRAPALLGNPVHAAAFLLGAFALGAERWPARAKPAGESRAEMLLLLALTVLIASAVQLSGGRTGLGLLAVVVVRLVFRVGVRRALPMVAAVGVGVVVAIVSVAALGLSDGEGAAERLAATSGSAFSGRVARWEMAEGAVADRPLLGIGPGLYRTATSPNNTVAAARAFGTDRLSRDAHNLFVEYLVTTGVIGLAALLTWLVLAARGARGELVWFAAVGGVSLLLQPQFVGLTPVLAMALGAAKTRASPGSDGAEVPPPRLGRSATAMSAIMAVAGLIAAAVLVVGDAHLQRAKADLDPAAGRAATRALVMWPEPAIAEARAYGYVAVTKTRPSEWRRALAAARTAVRRDPTDPESLKFLGSLELNHGRRSSARAAFESAVRWDPYSAQALMALASLAAARGDVTTADHLCSRAQRVAHRINCPVAAPEPRAGG